MFVRTFVVIVGLVAYTVTMPACSGCTSDESSDVDGAADDATVAVGDDDDGATTACEMHSDCPVPQVCRIVAGRGRICVDQCREDLDCCTDPRVTCGRRCVEHACVDAAPESCNGVDDNRDGTIDEGFDLLTDTANCGGCANACTDLLPHVHADGVTCDAGVCHIADDGCADGFWNHNGTDADGCEYPCHVRGDEEPNDLDDNCDGATDEGFACALGDEHACGSGTGVCEEGVQRCEEGVWSVCLDETAPTPEVCDGFDNDCDHEADEDTNFASDSAHCGACGNDCAVAFAGADATCEDSVCMFTSCRAGFMDLDGNVANGCELACDVWPPTDEACDAREQDEDCDGERNEGCDCVDGTRQLCGLADLALHGLGICHAGTQECADGAWELCVGAQDKRAETCNSQDDDCDGALPADEQDADADGVPTCAGDCNDTDWLVHPIPSSVAATGYSIEFCDGVDNDCDGRVDEDYSAGELCTGYGACSDAVGVWECSSFATVWCSVNFGGADFAGEIETANDVDDNCDGSVDEGLACVPGRILYCGLTDMTRHGHGICQRGTQECLPTNVWGACADAVDALPAERCNGVDDTCDDVLPADEVDSDGDGIRVCANDCNDANPLINPRSDEVCDGVDNDCDREVDEQCGIGLPCNVNAANACGVGELELNGAGGIRCSTMPGGSAYLARFETCNDLDDDCDGLTDDVPTGVTASDPLNCGACGTVCRFAHATSECISGTCGIAGCDGGFVDVDGDLATGCEYRCTPSVDPTDGPTTQCDRVDNDCDGTVDEGCSCPDGDRRLCGPEAPICDLDAVTCRGTCRLGAQRCDGGAWGTCNGARFPTAEACDGLDNDCDGLVPGDEDDGDGDGFAACAGDCNDAEPAINPTAEEVCDRTDNNCRGGTDEGFGVARECNVGVPNGCGVGVFECGDAGGVQCSTMPGGSVFPNLPEACDNRMDDNCDGSVDEDCGECNPATPPEACGLVDPDAHGVGVCHFGARTCQLDRMWGPCVGAVDSAIEVCDNLDNDCDGDVDEDFDLDSDAANCGACGNDCVDRPFVAAASCDTGACVVDACIPVYFDRDGDAANGCEASCVVTNDGAEQCDRIDNDCDGDVDEDFDLDSDAANCGACGTRCDPVHGTGACDSGACVITTCDAGYVDADGDPTTDCELFCTSTVDPTDGPTVQCDGLDNDCDGSVDEGCGCRDTDAPFACGPPPPACDVRAGTCLGECRMSSQECVGGALRACTAPRYPSAEVCDGLDNDCDGDTDEDFDLDTDAANCGACGNDCLAAPNVAAAVCDSGACDVVTCRVATHDLDGDPVNGCEYVCVVTKGGVEECDGVDNDCDGALDEDPVCNPPPPATRTVTFAITLPDGFPLDASVTLCSTFRTGTWACGNYAVVVGADGRTLTIEGDAVAGLHVANLCTSVCADLTSNDATYVVVKLPDGSLSAAAYPFVTFAALEVTESLVRNAADNGGNWLLEFVAP